MDRGAGFQRVRQKILAVIQLVEKGTLDVTRSVSEGERFQGI